MLMVEAETASVFAALGDPVRLALVGRLDRAQPRSIAALTAETDLTRQAVAKHLKVLEMAGVVRPQRTGREQHYALRVETLVAVEAYLQRVARKWDEALERLRAHLDE